MKKTLKWFLIVLGSLVTLIVLAGVLIPIIFKDDIKQAIDDQIKASINATVVYDIDNFSLSVFSHFPSITAEMKEFGVLNNEPFEGVVLFAAKSFEVQVNLSEVLFGDGIRVKGISLIEPIIDIRVLEDGRANWDIALPSSDTVQTTEEPGGDFQFGIDHWEIVNGDLSYQDLSLPMKVSLVGLNHNGGGDFSQAVFDLKTKTVVDSLSFEFDDAKYLSNKLVDIDATIAISEEYTKYTFKENALKVNDFAMHFDGWFKMNENDFGMDISYSTPDNSFKSLLSLVPGMFTESFKSIETSGNLAFEGKVSGTMSDDKMPKFNLALIVKDAMFKYPDLPTAVKNINVDLQVDNQDGIIDNTVIDLKKLHLDFGSNPVDATLRIANLKNYKLDANVIAKLNLAELSKMVPMEGIELKGDYAINLDAHGIYDEAKNIMPSVNADMSLNGGYVKSSDFPIPLEDLHFTSTVKNKNGSMKETFIKVTDLSMIMDGEKFTADLDLHDLVDYNWDLKAKGAIDLGKMSKLFPLVGMSVDGKIQADIATKGKYSDLEAERYEKLPTSGTAAVTGFKFKSSDLAYDVTISEGKMVFDPKQIELKRVEGTIGKSNYRIDGVVRNYIGYVFGKEIISGEMSFISSFLDLNEFMEEPEGAVQEVSQEEESFGVMPVPENINFVFRSTIKKVHFMDYVITDATGDVIVKDGIADLNGLKFKMLGGNFVVDGSYNAKDINHPRYDLKLKVDKMSVKQAANSFSVVEKYAPIAGLVSGDFSTDFKISGELNQDMMPNLGTINGSGLIEVIEGALTESRFIAGVTSLTNLDNVNGVKLKNALMQASIENGKLNVKPFDVNFGEYKTTVSGSTALDGSINYALKMDVPAGKLGSQFQSFVNENTGSSNPTDKVPVTIALGNTFLSPKFSLVTTEQKAQAKEALTNKAKEEGGKVLENLTKGTEAEGLVGNLLNKNKTTTGSDSTKKETTVQETTPKEEVKKKVEEEVKNKIHNLLKKK